MQLNEETRTQLLSKSKNADEYKDQRYGKNRFERSRYSKISKDKDKYNDIDMNDFFKRDILTVTIPVQGESKEYNVIFRFEGVLAEIAKNIKGNKNKLEFRTIIQALTKVFNTTDIYVKCNCEDFKFHYAHALIVNNVSVDDSTHDPGPGKTGITAEVKGRGCKHILLCIDNLDWIMQVASVLHNYIKYMEKNNTDIFVGVLFQKLYGADIEDFITEHNIDEKYIKNSAGLIDVINKLKEK